MIVTLIAQDQMSTTSLPERASGRYWISRKRSDGTSTNVADVEGIQNQWLLHGSSELILLDETGHETDSLPLSLDRWVINGRARASNQAIQLYVEPSTRDRQLYRKYCVRETCRLNIGRAADNQIVFDNRYVSAHHACLIWQNQRWSITDMQSSNGTFVNETRIAIRQLVPGDIVYIMGLKIIVGNGFFALNDPDHAVSLNAGAISEMVQQIPAQAGLIDRVEPELETFLSSPRLRRSAIRHSLSVDAPPAIQKIEEVPLALLLGPALTMGMTAIVMAVVAAINLYNGTSTLLTSLPTIIMSFAMLCGTVLWPMLTKQSERRRKAAAERERQAKYREYLDSVQNTIYIFGEEQRSVLLENNPSVSQCENRIINRERGLWERSAGQEDFLNLRLGIGEVPLEADIRFPDKRFTMEDDLLQSEVNRIADAPKLLADTPVVYSLLRNTLMGIMGAERETAAFLQSLILQIIALHSYGDVRLVFFVDEAVSDEWSRFKLLPHTWDETAELRYFAVSEEEKKAVCLRLEHILSERAEQRTGQSKVPTPHYVLVATSAAVGKSEIFAKVGGVEGLGFSALTVAEQLVDLPKECSMVIELAGDGSFVYDRNDLSRTRTPFRAEISDLGQINQVCGVLANLTMRRAAETYMLPGLLTFLELYSVGKTEHLNVLTRWRENSPVNTLRAPVGIGTDGAPFYLDLHEKAHGPHGLIAGMTGSGKSEFIITFLLSMAVNYHPDEVSFILIDYKGGGLAGAFEDSQAGVRLPHLAGTITNLDGTAVNRALISIQSELRRRQAVFNEAKQMSGEGTMDIYKYQKMYRSGIVTEPVPHLFIVSDEFAELKAQQPDFMAQLISTARIGRSLGVHLILATQKPSGVVDDQIWSNSRFRVCLKVQERADSMEMLKRPDAAELRDTGRFYLQVGFNELFELGQSAWCGAPYIPTDRVEKRGDDSVAVVDNLGRVLVEMRPKMGGASSNNAQVVSIVHYLSALGDAEHIAARRLWLPQIPELIYLDKLIEKYSWKANPFELNPIIGEYDDPFNQTQGLLTIPFSRDGNALIYGATGGGKTTLLNTLLVNLLQTYSAKQLNIYIVDMGEETLRVFADAPQVGDVLLSTDSEKVVGLFKLLQSEIAARKKLFTKGDGSYSSYCAGDGEILPQILVIIRNYAAFAEQFEQLDERLIQIARECGKYGIYLLMTANAANTVRYRVVQNFAKVYALQLNDVSDYIGLFNGTGGVYPSKLKGRGIYKTDRVYEFQTAHFAENASQEALRTFVTELSAGATTWARPIPVLPERVTPDFFVGGFKPSSVPVGVEKASLRASTWDLSRSVVSIVLSENMEELSATAQGICEQLARLEGSVTVLDGAGLLDEDGDMAYGYVKTGFEGRLAVLFDEMVHRNNTYKTAVANGRKPESYASEYYVIIGLQTILDGLSNEGKDKLNTLLEKAELSYHICFILCDSAKAVSDFSAAPWYKRHVSGMDGIWVGDGIANQYALKVSKLTRGLYSELPPHFGYLVRYGKPTLVKLIVGENYEEETEQ